MKIKEFFAKISAACSPVFKKAAAIGKQIFGYVIMAVLFAGGLTSVGFVAALVIGGEVGTEICRVIQEYIFPALIYTSSGAVLFGLGSRLRWMHSIFHIFVVLGSSLQLISVLFYVL